MSFVHFYDCHTFVNTEISFANSQNIHGLTTEQVSSVHFSDCHKSAVFIHCKIGFYYVDQTTHESEKLVLAAS